MKGGFGSGRPNGSRRDKVEYSRSIDVNRLHKAGCLTPGRQLTQDAYKGGTWRLLRELSHALREQNRWLVE